jgi:hypothetical protein
MMVEGAVLKAFVLVKKDEIIPLQNPAAAANPALQRLAKRETGFQIYRKGHDRSAPTIEPIQ